MAVTIDPKPRLRLPSGDIPEPKVVHSRSWLPLGVVVWLGSVIIGHGILYGWLSGSADAPKTAETSVTGASPPMAPRAGPSAAATWATANSPPAPLPSAASKDPDQLPDCETALQNAKTLEDDIDESLPLDLARSPFGALLDSNSWSKPCRAPRAVRVHLCVVVKGGELLGATAATDPDDPSTSKCVIRAISRLTLMPDAVLRKVHLTIDLPSDKTR